MAKAVNIARSHRLDGIGEYYFSRRLREIAEIEAATGRQIVKLAMGSPDLPPHQSVIDRLAKEAQRLLQKFSQARSLYRLKNHRI